MLEKTIIAEIANAIGEEKVLTTPEDLICHAFDGTFAEHRADVVVVPTTTDEVSAVLQIAYREGIPVVPQGMASGLAAGCVQAFAPQRWRPMACKLLQSTMAIRGKERPLS